MKKFFVSLLALALIAVPFVAFAQSPQPDFSYADRWVIQIISYSQKAVTFLMVIATLWFIWTVISYIRVKEAKDAEEKKKAMLRGIIGLFVIVGIWGIIRIISSTLGVSGGSLNTNDTPCPPGMSYDAVNRICR